MRLALAFLALFMALTRSSVAAEPAAPASLHELNARGIDGKERALSEFKGQAVLVVNVASRCGYTKQYEGLQKLYERFKDQGFVILGFPSNDFLWQEPGSDEEIAKFCKLKYGVEFPMFSKVEVKGKNASPVYKFLSSAGAPKWNFHKYLVGKDGQVIAAFPSKVEPDAPELLSAIEAALKK